MDASLNKRLNEVKWGEYKIGELFAKIKIKALKYKTADLPKSPQGNYVLPALTAGIQNQGLNNYVPKNNATILKNVISISANGKNTGATFYQNKEFTVLQDAYAIRWKDKNDILNDCHYLFLAGTISKAIYGNYEWTNKAGWERIKTDKIFLPITSAKKIDFDFIEEFIAELEERSVAELEAWLRAAGFEDYNLTEREQIALKEIDKLEYQIFNVEELFGKSTRGKRLKSADRVTGSLPFVTAGETDEGISAFIGNRVTIFPANTTTIDMFGSAKYRNYEYGADDHIAVVHTQRLQEDAAIFVTSAIHRSSHNGQFDYGKNFYAKDADTLNIMLPANGVVPDYSKMATIISAVKKLVIKDVAEYANKKIRVAQQVAAK
ncbi:restriction endonuclease subunit S [Prevotella veroralis]|uniref:restriction endonuclease subunit S n=1 Tax=Prevotella veroralis TaxID=28137 RepID=UPI0009E3DA42|nr:restriction endonuclease subunit S [Prevotella veroralis]QUB42209.1 restriction endonuclease subunit S [Prevotella veroralis]